MVTAPIAYDDDAVAAAAIGSGGGTSDAATVASTVSSSVYRRGGAIESLLDRLKVDQETWVFDISVVTVVAIAGVFLLATLLMLLGLVYLFRKRDDLDHWRAFGGRRYDSELFSSATDMDERGSVCDGMGRRDDDEKAAATAAAGASGSLAAIGGPGGVACTTVLCDRCSTPMQLCTAPLDARQRPSGRPSSSSIREPKRKAPTPARSKTMWMVGRRMDHSESLLPLIEAPESRKKSRSYELLKEAEVAVL